VGVECAKREEDGMVIQGLIAKGESDVLEFKASFGKDVIETICAILP
jgi:hypothetical protein